MYFSHQMRTIMLVGMWFNFYYLKDLNLELDSLFNGFEFGLGLKNLNGFGSGFGFYFQWIWIWIRIQMCPWIGLDFGFEKNHGFGFGLGFVFRYGFKSKSENPNPHISKHKSLFSLKLIFQPNYTCHITLNNCHCEINSWSLCFN